MGLEVHHLEGFLRVAYFFDKLLSLRKQGLTIKISVFVIVVLFLRTTDFFVIIKFCVAIKLRFALTESRT